MTSYIRSDAPQLFVLRENIQMQISRFRQHVLTVTLAAQHADLGIRVSLAKQEEG